MCAVLLMYLINKQVFRDRLLFAINKCSRIDKEKYVRDHAAENDEPRQSQSSRRESMEEESDAESNAVSHGVTGLRHPNARKETGMIMCALFTVPVGDIIGSLHAVHGFCNVRMSVFLFLCPFCAFLVRLLHLQLSHVQVWSYLHA